MPKRFLAILFGEYNYAGITQVAVQLAIKLRETFDITLICRRIVRKVEEGVEIIELRPKTTLELWKMLGKTVDQFDIVHTHDVYTLPGLLRRKRKARIIYTDHGIVPMKYSRIASIPGTLFAHFCRLFSPRADLTVGISDYIVDELRQIGCQSVVKIPNGIDTEKFRPISEPEKILKLKCGNPMLLKVGLIEMHKAIDYHIASMPFILKKFPEARLVFIGTGRDLAYYRAKVKALRLDRVIHFIGWVPHEIMPLYYNAADIVLAVDYCHSFGLPILEGMACGKPVIARNGYAMREHVLNSRAGVLVQGENPREVATAVDQIMDNYDFYSSRAREYAKLFDWGVIAAQYRKVYESVLAES
jgi:glycosyltransferase involved in cell wall biosynthesis